MDAWCSDMFSPKTSGIKSTSFSRHKEGDMEISTRCGVWARRHGSTKLRVQSSCESNSGAWPLQPQIGWMFWFQLGEWSFCTSWNGVNPPWILLNYISLWMALFGMNVTRKVCPRKAAFNWLIEAILWCTKVRAKVHPISSKRYQAALWNLWKTRAPCNRGSLHSFKMFQVKGNEDA